jgi:hypothetical protein
LSLLGVASPSLLINGGAGMDHHRVHAIAPAKPHESRVYDSSGAHDLPHARGSCIQCAGGGIHRGLCSSL